MKSVEFSYATFVSNLISSSISKREACGKPEYQSIIVFQCKHLPINYYKCHYSFQKEGKTIRQLTDSHISSPVSSLIPPQKPPLLIATFLIYGRSSAKTKASILHTEPPSLSLSLYLSISSLIPLPISSRSHSRKAKKTVFTFPPASDLHQINNHTRS